MDLCVVIMAGGIGTRFWPFSRRKKPKQFLPIISEKTMIEETVNRISPKIPFSRIYTIADHQKTQTIKAFFPDIPEENFLIEKHRPLPALGLSCHPSQEAGSRGSRASC